MPGNPAAPGKQPAWGWQPEQPVFASRMAAASRQPVVSVQLLVAQSREHWALAFCESSTSHRTPRAFAWFLMQALHAEFGGFGHGWGEHGGREHGGGGGHGLPAGGDAAQLPRSSLHVSLKPSAIWRRREPSAASSIASLSAADNQISRLA